MDQGRTGAVRQVQVNQRDIDVMQDVPEEFTCSPEGADLSDNSNIRLSLQTQSQQLTK